MEFPIFFLASVVCIALFFLFRGIDNEKYEKFVRNYSVALKELQELNKEYRFFNVDSCKMSHTFDNEKMFRQIECQDYLIYQLQFEQGKIIEQIKRTNQNARIYNKYLADVKNLCRMGIYEVPYGKLKREKLMEIEKKIYDESVMHPCVSFRLLVTLYCSKINGNIYDKKREMFNDDRIFSLIRRVNDKNGYFFNDREIWDSIALVERGKVSNKMRFAIYERDGYRCRKCGASGQYANLEIDHIVPIAKGGKSTYHNLQTLCHRCNVEKGDRVPYERWD